MIPRSEGPRRPIGEHIRLVEAHRAGLRAGFIAALVEGREPTAEETEEHLRDERAMRVARQMRARIRARGDIQRTAEQIVQDEYQKWLRE